MECLINDALVIRRVISLIKCERLKFREIIIIKISLFKVGSYC